MSETALSLDQFASMYAQDRKPITRKEREKIMDEADEWARQHRWAINKREFVNFVTSHQYARKNGDERRMIFIEEVLTEINFHTACSCLHFGEYDKALADWTLD